MPHEVGAYAADDHLVICHDVVNGVEDLVVPSLAEYLDERIGTLEILPSGERVSVIVMLYAVTVDAATHDMPECISLPKRGHVLISDPALIFSVLALSNSYLAEQ